VPDRESDTNVTEQPLPLPVGMLFDLLENVPLLLVKDVVL
jgi:hypothetical protein